MSFVYSEIYDLASLPDELEYPTDYDEDEDSYVTDEINYLDDYDSNLSKDIEDFLARNNYPEDILILCDDEESYNMMLEAASNKENVYMDEYDIFSDICGKKLKSSDDNYCNYDDYSTYDCYEYGFAIYQTNLYRCYIVPRTQENYELIKQRHNDNI